MATIKEIAEQLNISPSTVSRALNDSKLISSEVRKRVVDTAASLGYAPKVRAKKTAIDSNLAGIIIPDISAEYYGKIAACAERKLSQKGMHPLVQCSAYDVNRLLQAIEVFSRVKVRCVLVITDIEEKLTDSVLQTLYETQIPSVVVASSESNFLHFDCVKFDEKLGITLGLQHLLARGNEKIGFIGSPDVENRYHLFRQVMEENRIQVNPQHVVMCGEKADRGGYQAMKELLSRSDRPDAVFAGYDMFAIGAIHALQEEGYSVPKDMSIIGFDNIDASSYMSGGITTIGFSYEEMVSIVIRILETRLSTPGAIIQKVILQPKLIVRSTT